jgi:hypothetical protein
MSTNSMDFLIDHDIEGQARLLFETIRQEGWLSIVTIRFVEFPEAGIALNISDRDVWRYVQAQRMFLLTENRQMNGPDSLEVTLRQELTATALPVLTVRDKGRLQADVHYRQACAEDIADIASDPDARQGIDRLYIPLSTHATAW